MNANDIARSCVINLVRIRLYLKTNLMGEVFLKLVVAGWKYVVFCEKIEYILWKILQELEYEPW
mgnify:CR=1 FL=1